MLQSRKLYWAGWVITVLAAIPFGISSVMKFLMTPNVVQGFAHLGLPDTMILPLGILELTCLIIYLIPQTAVLGAILMAGYMGGAICTHWRAGDPFFGQIIIGLLVWLGVYLREVRLGDLIPLRRKA